MDAMFADTMKNKKYFSGCQKFEEFSSINQKFPKLMGVLDDKSKVLFWHIWRNRHAKIRELSNRIRARNDIDTLSRLREVINAQAEKILGKQILKFAKSKIDPLTGDKILFSWWLNEECFDAREMKESFDILDEPKRLRIVMKLPDNNGNGLKINVNQNNLLIQAGAYQKTIPLFYKVKNEISKTYKNGILEISLEKV